ncbi:hypothetical protein GCM10011591_38260 [Nocardia camponoti]|uniref:Uncharacterized protein n=1 Tax=Nocardia camponoti TaxID=1616106 RepID=A0A917VCD2_9NOCA|nr:hypothetical protein GCM10011591_38260 [Nocardia camponoti]
MPDKSLFRRIERPHYIFGFPQHEQKFIGQSPRRHAREPDWTFDQVAYSCAFAAYVPTTGLSGANAHEKGYSYAPIKRAAR